MLISGGRREGVEIIHYKNCFLFSVCFAKKGGMEVMETVTDIRTEGILNLEYVSGKGNDILCQKQFFSDTHVSQFGKVTLKAGNYASDFQIQIIMKTSPALIEFK